MSARDDLARRRAALLDRAANERREVRELGERVTAPFAWIERGVGIVRGLGARPVLAAVGAIGLVGGRSPAACFRWAGIALDVALLAVRVGAILRGSVRGPAPGSGG